MSTDKSGIEGPAAVTHRERESESRRGIFTRTRVVVATVVTLSFLSAAGASIGAMAASIESELNSTAALVPKWKFQVAASDVDGAQETIRQIQLHTATARQSADNPLWVLASGLPWAGANLGAIAEVSRSADDVANLGLEPLTTVLASLNWDSLVPGEAGVDLASLREASATVGRAAYTVRSSAERLGSIDLTKLLPDVREPISSASQQLQEATGALTAAADASKLAPEMMGVDEARTYLLLIQNNAESRASGGIPGALAIVTLEDGKLDLSAQSSAGQFGVMSPVLPVDPAQQEIYSTRLGKFVQDVNLTPDFPTAAATAKAMWERKAGQQLDGVISVDPVVLSYILKATGPVLLSGEELSSATSVGLPEKLTSDNVVPTLLSDVYATIESPALQDKYFASVAQQVFGALSTGKGDPKGLLTALTRGTAEGRVLLWSADSEEQGILNTYPVSGSIAGPSISPAQFGVYFNDGTGAKMDYYVRRTVQLIKECPRGGYEQTTVRVTSTNTAPPDAATSLPAYVTGGGVFDVPPGSVETNVVAYGPVQAHVETAKLDGQHIGFAPYLHSNRPVGVLAIRLAPGESRTVDFAFGKIVQHAEPNVVVTPGVQDVKDVVLPTKDSQCD